MLPYTSPNGKLGVVMPYQVKCIVMHINASSLNQINNSLCQSFNGLIGHLWRVMINFHSSHTCWHLLSSKWSFDTKLRHGVIMDFYLIQKRHSHKIKPKPMATIYTIITWNCTRCCCFLLLLPGHDYAMWNFHWGLVILCSWILSHASWLFVIQDVQEGDALCGQFGSHTTGIQRHCRACNVSADDLDNPQAECKLLETNEMHLIASNQRRWEITQITHAALPE